MFGETTRFPSKDLESLFRVPSKIRHGSDPKARFIGSQDLGRFGRRKNSHSSTHFPQNGLINSLRTPRNGRKSIHGLHWRSFNLLIRASDKNQPPFKPTGLRAQRRSLPFRLLLPRCIVPSPSLVGSQSLAVDHLVGRSQWSHGWFQTRILSIEILGVFDRDPYSGLFIKKFRCLRWRYKTQWDIPTLGWDMLVLGRNQGGGGGRSWWNKISNSGLLNKMICTKFMED